MSCHNALTLAGGHDYSSYATTTVVANGVIVKGSPLASKMYIATRDKIMPKVGAPLNDAETKAIYDWILAGALDN